MKQPTPDQMRLAVDSLLPPGLEQDILMLYTRVIFTQFFRSRGDVKRWRDWHWDVLINLSSNISYGNTGAFSADMQKEILLYDPSLYWSVERFLPRLTAMLVSKAAGDRIRSRLTEMNRVCHIEKRYVR